MTATDLGGALAVSEHMDWLRSIRRSSNTIEDRARLVIRMAKWLGALDPPKSVLDATPQDLYRWQLSLQGFASNTTATYIAHAKGFYGWLAKYRGGVDAGELLVRPALPRQLPRPIEDSALREAFQLADDRLQFMLFMMAFCGARCCEVARAERAHLRDHADPPKAFLYGKGGKERIVPLPHGANAALDQWALPSRGFVARGAAGRPLTPNRVSGIVNSYLHSVGIPDTAHSIRHWYATNAYRITKDIRLVQEMMGHASPATTAIYTLIDPANVETMVGALDQSLAHMLGITPERESSRHLRLIR